jgi:Transposase IS116/IS110/IS902 family
MIRPRVCGDEHVLAIVAAPVGAVVAQRAVADQLREELRGLSVQRLIDRCCRLRRSATPSPDELAARLVLRTLARRIEAVTVEAVELEREILAHVRVLARQLLDEPGVGPIVAAQLLVAWSHRGRVRAEAAFARLAGVAPVSASSGQTRRQRLSRGGDRPHTGAIQIPRPGARRIRRSAVCRAADRDVQTELHRFEDGKRDETFDPGLVEEEAFAELTALVHAASD